MQGGEPAANLESRSLLVQDNLSLQYQMEDRQRLHLRPGCSHTTTANRRELKTQLKLHTNTELPTKRCPIDQRKKQAKKKRELLMRNVPGTCFEALRGTH